MADLSVNLGGLKLKNPILTASGTFGSGREFEDFFDINMLGGIVTKTVTLREKKGNVPPRICETNCGMINAIGLQNPGVDVFIKENGDYLESLKTNVFISISGESIEDFAKVAEKINVLDIAGLEINVSCPNVKKGGMLFGVDPEAVFNITRAVKEAFKGFVIVKLTPLTHLVSEAAVAAQEAGANAVCAINTVPAIAVDIKKRKSKIGNITGGLSGPAIKNIGQKIVYEISKKVSIPIIGCGGIMSSDDAIEYLILGASAVQVGSASFKNPYASVEILEGIKKFLLNNNIGGINEIIGSFIE